MRHLSAVLLLAVLSAPAPGQTWTPQASGRTNILHSTFFLDPLRGWTVGDAGTSLRTADGGQSWTPVTLTAQDLSAVAFTAGGTGVIAGDNGLLFRSTNAGASWGAVGTGTAVNLEAAAFGTGGLAVIGGRDGLILRSSDDGASWTTAETGTVRYRGAAASGPSRAWLVGEGGVIRATTNGGASWLTPASGTASDLHAVLFLSEQEGFAGGQNSTLLYTSDGGVSWGSRNTGITAGIDAIAMLPTGEGYAVGNGGAIFRTTNRGLLWIPEASGTTQGLNAVFMTDAGHVWAAGDAGTILFRGTQTAVGEEGTAAAAFRLHPNYPNPFNPSTRIRFDLRERSAVRLVVYNALGQAVGVPVEGELPAGEHTAVWDAAGMAGGVYFYRLESAGSPAGPARSMVLIR